MKLIIQKGVIVIKLPNGYGSVVKLSGKRRNPFMVRKTRGFDHRGYPIYEIIGYYPTRESGLIALANYNNDPYDIDREKTTLEELFQLWKEKKMLKLGKGSQNSLKSAYNHCERLYTMKYKTIRAFNMQECVDGCGRGYSTQGAIKNLFGHLDKFALELDIINRCYSELVTSAPVPETNKVPFTNYEVSQVWSLYKRTGFPWCDSVLFFLYTGFRISEMLELKTANINLTAGTMQGGTKTRNGKDRIVPIHSKIAHIVENRMKKNSIHLFGELSVTQYYNHWDAVMEKLNLEHTPHECRHTFRTMLDNAGANKRCIDLLMGHKSKDVGERVYTHKTVEQLKETIELIKN